MTAEVRLTAVEHESRLMRVVRKPFQILRADLGVYITLNVITYGVFLAGFVTALIFPELRAAQVASLEADGTADLVVSLTSNVWLFALVILGINTLTVGALSILLPSMILPFAGVAIFGYRAFDIGLTLAPSSEAAWVALIPHSLTILVEFQAYVLLLLGAYLLGRSWLLPRTIGAHNRRQGYVCGLKQIGWLSLPALALFVFGALYEAFSLVYVVPPLVHGLT